MYLHHRATGAQLRTEASAQPPCGPGFDPPEIARAAELEVWTSDISDPHPDYTLFKLLDSAANVVAVKIIDGY